jgi:hypothetical protein
LLVWFIGLVDRPSWGVCLGGWVSLTEVRFSCCWCCGIFWSLFVYFSADR